MIKKLLEVIERCGLYEDVEEEFEINSPQDAFRLFAVNYDVRPYVDIIKKLGMDTEGVREIIEELDVDTCEAEFVIFFLSDVYDELPNKEIIDRIIKEVDPKKAVPAIALYLLLYKAAGKEEIDEVLNKVLSLCSRFLSDIFKIFMDPEKLAEKIEKKIREVIVREAGGEKRILAYEPIIRIKGREDGGIDVDIELSLEVSPLSKKSKEEIIKAVREEVDKLIQEETGKKPIEDRRFRGDLLKRACARTRHPRS